MAAPLRQFMKNILLQKYNLIEVCKSRSVTNCKHACNSNPILAENLDLSPRSCKGITKTFRRLLLAESGRTCTPNFGGGIRQVTAALHTSTHLDGPQSSRYSHHNNNGNVSLALGIGGFAMCSAGLAFTFWKEDNKLTIEKIIARAIIAERENRLGDADMFYHQATVMCEKEKNTQALLYTYDQMANFNMRHGRLMQAENLFKETIKLLLTSGIQREDPGVVEISLKLSRIYERMGRNKEADVGFNWCVETSEKLLKDTTDDSTEESHAKILNLKSLLGISLESYARFLGETNRLADAEKLYKRALEICEGDLKIDGTPHPQTVVLLNDLGTICDMRGHRDEAMEHVERALELAKKSSPDVLPTILANLASIKMHKGLNDEARDLYKRALVLAEKDGDREAVLTIRANLQKVL